MSTFLCASPFVFYPKQPIFKITIRKPIDLANIYPSPKHFSSITSKSAAKCSVAGDFEKLTPVSSPEEPRWASWLATAASLYPLYVTVGGVVACIRPSSFSWFVDRGPGSYSLTLGFIMLAMGITLELRDLINLFMQRPLSVSS